MGITGLIIVVVIVLAVTVTAMVRESDPFKTAASQLNLDLTRTVPELRPQLDGVVNGLHVKVDIATSRGPTVRYRVFYPALGLSLRLERETTISRTMGQLGRTDIQIGATGFDHSFRVTTSRPDALRDMMTPQRQRALVELIEDFPHVLIEDDSISLVSDTSEPPAATIVSTIIHLAAAGHLLVEGRPPPPEKPSPTQDAITAVAEPDPSPPARSQEPASPPAAESLEAILVPPSVASPPPASGAQSTGLPDGFFEDVFGANRLTFEADSDLTEQIRGTLVTLSGSVKQAREYDQDSDFGDSPGTKAVVTVAQIDTDLYGKTTIDAVVQLPAGAATGLSRGTTVTVEGILDRVDPFMRSLFVTGARLRRISE
ncbi:MAG: hypothetical protein U9N84_02925 [Actinomycetota bacterium]|nr:hypothetical protein [Actinomycetota bacterium]